MSSVKIWIDPVTRVAGHLALYAEVDASTRRTTKAHVSVLGFRGIEVFLRGRPPEDAIHITSRTCGACGAAHANASVRANDFAAGMTPYPMGTVLRNMAYAMADYVYDHSIINNMLIGPDYSEVVVSKLTPSVWRAARETPAQYSHIHGFRTVADIMEALNPINGKIWQLTVKYQNIAREAAVLIYGRHSHPSTLIPGGISTDATLMESLFEQYYARLTRITAWAKYMWAWWQDIYDFFEKQVSTPDGKPYSSTQGITYDPWIALSYGWAEDPEVYSNAAEEAKGDWRELYARMDRIFETRAERAGLMIGGEFWTRSAREIARGFLEFVDSSWYGDWVKQNVPPPYGWLDKDPAGEPLAFGSELYRYHPWNRTTLPKPGAINFAEKYTWVAEPRLIRRDQKVIPFESGPITVLAADALSASKFEMAGQTWWTSNGSVLKIHLPGRTVAEDLPEGSWEEMDIEWHLPKYSTTVGRVLARAVHVAMVVAIAWANLLYGLQLISAGRVQLSRPWTLGKWPSFSYGAGLMQVPRGTLSHWLVQQNGRIANYQYQAPTTGNASPANGRCNAAPWDRQCAGPFEMTLRNSVVTEELPPSQWTGLDFVRGLRSYDPCLVCSAQFEFKGEAGQVYASVQKVIWSVCSL